MAKADDGGGFTYIRGAGIVAADCPSIFRRQTSKRAKPCHALTRLAACGYSLVSVVPDSAFSLVPLRFNAQERTKEDVKRMKMEALDDDPAVQMQSMQIGGAAGDADTDRGENGCCWCFFIQPAT